jgi:hypothetical protein
MYTADLFVAAREREGTATVLVKPVHKIALMLLIGSLVFVPLSLFRTPIRHFVEDALPFQIQIDRLLRMGGEGSLSGWYAVSLFLAAAGMMVLVRRTLDHWAQRRMFSLTLWLVVLIGLDQTILLHDRFLAVWLDQFGRSIGWLPAVVALFLLLVRQSRLWSPSARHAYELAWILIFAGYAWGVVTELYFPLNRTHEVITELLKMFGAIALFVASMRHLAAISPETTLTFQRGGRLLAALVGLSLLFGVLTAAFYALQTRVDLDTLDPYRFLYLLDAGQESTIATFYSVFLWRLCALLLMFIAIGNFRHGKADARRWMGLSAIFVYLSADEASSLHEQLIGISRAAVARLNLDSSGLFYHAWVVPVGLAVLLLFFAYLPFLRRLPRETALWMLFSGVLFVSGALGLEMVGGTIVTFARENDALRLSVETLEELLEMLALSFFAFSLTQHLAHQIGALTFRFADSQPHTHSPNKRAITPG